MVRKGSGYFSLDATEVSAQTRRVFEGETELLVPSAEEPAKFPSFFNNQGKFVRDVSIVCYKAFASTATSVDGAVRKDLIFADSLAGTGVRGIRVANEVPQFSKVCINDISPTSLALARSSAEVNKVSEKCIFSKEEVCSFLSSRNQISGERFDVVDVDPFGSPSPFVDCALRAVKHGGLLSVTATDTAVLCGVYPKVALRKYLGVPIRTDYSHEVGVRLIFGLLSMTAMRFECSIEPIFCHHDRHYFRAYCLVRVGNRYSLENERNIGFVKHCFKCGQRSILPQSSVFALSVRGCLPDSGKGQYDSSFACEACGANMTRFAGPLWTGKIQSLEFVKSCSGLSDLSIFKPELDLPLYYDLAQMSDSLGIRTPKISEVFDKLTSGGRSASRTRLNRNALRTDCPALELQKILKELAR